MIEAKMSFLLLKARTSELQRHAKIRLVFGGFITEGFRNLSHEEY